MSELEKELAKAGGQVITETARDARKAVAEIFGDAARELAATMADSVRLWRFKNLLRVADEVRQIAADRGLSPEQLKALPIGDALRVTQAASDEDCPEIQRLWARLIANATAPDSTVEIERAFIDLLKSLSPAEAVFLDLLWAMRTQDAPETREARHARLLAKASATWRPYPAETRQIAIQNLFRMRCIAVFPPHGHMGGLTLPAAGSGNPREASRAYSARVLWKFRELTRYASVSLGARSVRDYDAPDDPRLHETDYNLTPLGWALMRACAIDA